MLIKEIPKSVPEGHSPRQIFEQSVVFNPRNLLDKYTREFPIVMDMLKVGLVHPDSRETAPNPYVPGEVLKPMPWIGEHCLAAGLFFDIIGNRLVKKGVLNEEQFITGLAATLSHDAGKRDEIARSDAFKKKLVTFDPYSDQAYENALMFKDIKAANPELFKLMVHAGTLNGHGSQKFFLKLDLKGQIVLTGSILDQLIHLVDDLCATSIPKPGEKAQTICVTPEDKIYASNFAERYGELLWQIGIGFDSNGLPVDGVGIEHPPEGLRSIHPFINLQVALSNQICSRIVWKMGYNKISNPEKIVVDMVNQQLASLGV